MIGAIAYFVQTPAGLDALGRLALGQMSNAAPVFGASVAINAPSAAARFAVTSGANTLSRSGADFDLVYGGIGHYLEAIERARELARITRKTPAPIVQPPLPPPLSAPAASRPTAIDLQAVAAQQAAEQQAQAERARIARRRRQEAEILLLAS